MKVNRSKKKLQIRVRLENLGTSFPHQNLRKLLDWLTEKETEYISKGFTNLELHFDSDWDGPSDLVIFGTREETEEEYNARMRAIAEEERQEAFRSLSRRKQEN